MMVSLRILGALACLGMLGSAACGDDGRVLGERSTSGGASGQAGASMTGGSSGDGTGGTTSSGGAAGEATGGDTGVAGANGGSGSSAGGGGAGASNGGAAGSAGSDDGNGAMGGASGVNCVDRTCAPTEVCVAYRTIGGAQIRPDDAGACPGGSHAENGYCMAGFGYQCITQPRCAAAEITCACGTCPQGYTACRAPYVSEWLDPAAMLVCEQLAP